MNKGNGSQAPYSSGRVIMFTSPPIGWFASFQKRQARVQTRKSSQNQFLSYVVHKLPLVHSSALADQVKCRLHCLCDVIPENFRSVVSLVPKYPATFKHFKRKSAMSVTWKKLSLLRSVSWVTKWYVLMYFFTSSLRAAFFWIGENYCRNDYDKWISSKKLPATRVVQSRVERPWRNSVGESQSYATINNLKNKIKVFSLNDLFVVCKHAYTRIPRAKRSQLFSDN